VPLSFTPCVVLKPRKPTFVPVPVPVPVLVPVTATVWPVAMTLSVASRACGCQGPK